MLPSGAAGFALGVGARVVWNTSGIFGGRRVRGSTFIVPLTIGSYEGAGQITAGVIATMQGAANTLAGFGPDGMFIWSRPQPGTPGEAQTVTGAIAPDRVSWLRSRRT